MIKKTTLSLAIAGLYLSNLAPNVARADSLSSDWVMDQHTKSRLFVGGYDKEKGILYLGWQLSLKADWKTYWRSPGDAGLPPRWDWKDTRNIKTITVSWPKPEMLHIFGLDTYIYHHELILPIEVKVADAGEATALALDLQYLICADVCIPQEGSYKIDISSLETMKPSRFQQAQLNRYRDLVPVKISNQNITAKPDPDQSNSLMIQLPETLGMVESIIIEGPDNLLLGRAKSNGTVRFTLPYNGDQPLVGQELDLTLLLKDGGARETKITVIQ